jgi:hypothetical protein
MLVLAWKVKNLKREEHKYPFTTEKMVTSIHIRDVLKENMAANKKTG